MSQITIVPIGGNAEVLTLTADTGGEVPPVGGTIFIVGGLGITTSGNPGTNTITITASGVTFLNYTNVTSTPYVVLANDEYLSVDTSVARTIQLPNTTTAGKVFIIKDRTGSAAANNITVTTVGGVVTIDGGTSYVMNTNRQSIQVIFNGTNYEVF